MNLAQHEKKMVPDMAFGSRCAGNTTICHEAPGLFTDKRMGNRSAICMLLLVVLCLSSSVWASTCWLVFRTTCANFLPSTVFPVTYDGYCYLDNCTMVYAQGNACGGGCSWNTSGCKAWQSTCDNSAELKCEHNPSDPSCKSDEDRCNDKNVDPSSETMFRNCVKIDGQDYALYETCTYQYLYVPSQTDPSAMVCDSVLNTNMECTTSYREGDVCADIECTSYTRSESKGLHYDVLTGNYIGWTRDCTYQTCGNDQVSETENTMCTDWVPYTETTFGNARMWNIPSDSSALDTNSSNFGNNVHCAASTGGISTMYSDNGEVWNCEAESCSEALKSYMSGGSCYKNVNRDDQVPDPRSSSSSPESSPSSSPSSSLSSSGSGQGGEGGGSSGSGGEVTGDGLIDTLHHMHREQEQLRSLVGNNHVDLMTRLATANQLLNNMIAVSSAQSAALNKANGYMRSIDSVQQAYTSKVAGSLANIDTSINGFKESFAAQIQWNNDVLKPTIEDVSVSVVEGFKDIMDSAKVEVQPDTITRDLVDSILGKVGKYHHPLVLGDTIVDPSIFHMEDSSLASYGDTSSHFDSSAFSDAVGDGLADTSDLDDLDSIAQAALTTIQARNDTLAAERDSMIDLYLDSMQSVLQIDSIGGRISRMAPVNRDCPTDCFDVELDWPFLGGDNLHISCKFSKYICEMKLFGLMSGLEFMRLLLSMTVSLFCVVMIVNSFIFKRK